MSNSIGLRAGNPEEWREFQERHPAFCEAWPRLKKALEDAFERRVRFVDHTLLLILGLGRLAVEDFSEILLLSMNGYGVGALKLLRPLFERVVTGLYLLRHPAEAQDFVDFTYVHQRKLINHAKASGVDLMKLFTKAQLDEVEVEYQRAKDRFEEPLCKKCGTTQDQLSWTKKDLKTQSDEVGMGEYYGMAAFWPTLHLHTTRTALDVRLELTPNGVMFKAGPQRKEADHALAHAHLCLLFLLDGYNRHFGWSLDTDALFRDAAKCWNPPESDGK